MAAEKLREVVDHELLRDPKETHLILARDTVRPLAIKSLLHPKPAGATTLCLVSWVESLDETRGRALAIREEYGNEVFPRVSAQLYTANRDTRQLAEAPIGMTLLDPRAPLDVCVDNLVEQFSQDKEALETIARMVGKSMLTHLNPRYALDKLVFIAITNHDDILDELAANFPSNLSPTNENVDIAAL